MHGGRSDGGENEEAAWRRVMDGGDAAVTHGGKPFSKRRYSGNKYNVYLIM